MRVAMYTLGCKVNQYETQAMERELLRRGHEIVAFEDEADAYVVNTCSVTAVSDKKSRQMLRRAKAAHPAAVVAACGCYSQTHADESECLELDIVAGSAEREKFLDALEETVRERRYIRMIDDPLRRREFEVLPAGSVPGRTRAILKIEDGCTNFCSYCIIPFSRGPIRSLPMAEGMRQLRALDAEGYRETVITGIEIAGYGRDLSGNIGLVDFLDAAAEAVPAMRLRLGSLEARIITEDFCRRLSRHENLCPHFHLSLQSGADATLRRMNRKYTTAEYLHAVELLRQYFPNVAITTDLITGFPGETEEEFAETLAFIERVGFADMHIFPYSVRPGTAAAKLPGQLSKAVKEERAHRAAAVAEEMHRAFLASMVGTVVPVLFEQKKEDGRFYGHAPNYTEISVAEEGLHNEIRNVRLVSVDGDTMRGELI